TSAPCRSNCAELAPTPPSPACGGGKGGGLVGRLQLAGAPQLFSVIGAQPISARQDPVQRVLIDEGHDGLVEGILQIVEFFLASLRAMLGQEVDARLRRLACPRAGATAFDEIPECFGIAAIGDAEVVVEALRLRAARIGKIAARPGAIRGFEEKCRAVEQPARVLSAELQHEKTRELVGGVLLATPTRHFENIENGV